MFLLKISAKSGALVDHCRARVHADGHIEDKGALSCDNAGTFRAVDNTNCEPIWNAEASGGDCTSAKSADALVYTINEGLESVDFVLESGDVELARGNAVPTPECHGSCCPGVARVETSR